MSDYLQTFAEVLKVRHEPGVFVSFVEPGTAADFSGSLLPVHSVALPLLDMYIIPLAIYSYDHLFVLFSYCTISIQIDKRIQIGFIRQSPNTRFYASFCFLKFFLRTINYAGAVLQFWQQICERTCSLTFHIFMLKCIGGKRHMNSLL